ncbi:MAG: TetR/AcrR family transcriptional regulator [Myxococcales bacterium]|nr:TetR/AcrR family transcriptional regulator [Myxococcales bacterium]
MSRALRTRDRILEGAIDLAAQLGLEGLSLGHLAERLGLSKSGLYAHFGSKEDLQIQVLGAAAERFVDEVVRPALEEPRGAPRVAALCERWLAWASTGRSGGCVFVAAGTELDDRSGPVRDALEATQRAWLETLARACRIAQEEGHYEQGVDPRQFAFELQGILFSFHHQARLLRDPEAANRARRAFGDLDARARGGASSREPSC